MIELLFKYPLTVYRKGDFLFASGWPAWLLVLLVLAAGAALFVHMERSQARLSKRQKLTLWGLQAAMAAVALFALWQPGLSIRSLRSQQNVVSVLIDSSRSMALGEAEKSRLQQAVDALNAGVIEGLEEKFRVRLYGFAGDADRIESLDALPAPGSATRVGEAVASVLRESAATPLGAVVVVSDGSDNSGAFSRDLMAEIRKRNVPVHTVGVGRETMPNDLELAEVAVPTDALPKARVTAQATIRHPGEGGKTRLTVRDGDKIIGSQEVDLARGETVQSVRVDFPAGDPGIRDLRFSLDALAGEEILGNNQARRVMDVPRSRKKVLYVEGEPRWEYKFLRRAVIKDESVQLVTLLRTSANKFYRQGVDSAEDLKEGFPTEREELFAYDGLMIGSFEAAMFTPEQQSMIRDFVSKRGGSLMMIAGRNGLADGGWAASQVADALPAKLDGDSAKTFRREKASVHLTPHGADSLITRLDSDPAKNRTLWEEMPAVADYQMVGELKPAAVTLLEYGEDRRPLLVTQNYGRGRSYIFATGGSWRWKMSLPHDDERHHTFWRQLLRSLTTNATDPVTISSDRSLYADDPRIQLRAEARTKEFEAANNAVVTATLTPETGEPVIIEMHPSPDEEGVYLAEAIAAEPGAYRVEAKAFLGDESLGNATLHVRREDGVAEDFRPAQNRELLTRLAEQTGGQYWSLDEVAGLPEQIRFSEAGISAREILDLWDMPAMFLLLLGLKAGEWTLRRRWGTI